jgi:predicted O-linked N-acetylglucosamine transferase (SPINDLY family)
VEIAVAKSADLMALAVLRKQLRGTMTGSPVGDAAAYVREVEELYRQLWRQWCARAVTGVAT